VKTGICIACGKRLPMLQGYRKPILPNHSPDEKQYTLLRACKGGGKAPVAGSEQEAAPQEIGQ